MRSFVKIAVAALWAAVSVPSLSAQELLLNSAVDALRGANNTSGEELYQDYLEFEDFVKLPPEFGYSEPDAIYRHGNLMEYVENRVAASYGRLLDDFARVYAKGYDASARDATKANIGVELFTAPVSLVLDPSPQGLILGRVASGAKIWASSAVQDYMLRDPSIQKFREDLEKDHNLNSAYLDALRDLRRKAAKVQVKAEALEKNPTADSAGSQSDASGAQRKKCDCVGQFASELGSARTKDDAKVVRKKVETGAYGPELSKEKALDLVDAAIEFAESSDRVAGYAVKTAAILNTAGIDLPPRVSDAIRVAQTVTKTATAFANKDYFGAAMGVASLLGPRRPDHDQLRFEAIMGALSQVSQKLDIVVANQDIILKMQAETLARLDRLQWSLERGVQDLELTIEESKEEILSAIFLSDDRDLGRCVVSAEMFNSVLFPRPGGTVNLFQQPNTTEFSSLVIGRLASTEKGSIQRRLDYLATRLEDNLPICMKKLVEVLGGLQAKRGIDGYLHLNRIETLTDQETGYSGDHNDARKKLIAETAKGFRTKVYQPQFSYLRQAIKKTLTQNPLVEFNEEDVLAYLALRAPARIPGYEAAAWPFAAPEKAELDDLDLYFNGALREVMRTPLAASTSHFTARIVADIHVLIGLMADRAQRDGLGFSLESPSIVRQETALRFLLQSLQVLDVLRAQQSIIDGRALLPFLYDDIAGADLQAWTAAAARLEQNAQVRTNFSRYLFAQSLERNEKPPQAYGAILATNNPKWIEAAIAEVLPKTLTVKVTCRAGDISTADQCGQALPLHGSVTPFELVLKKKDAPENAPSLALILPAPRTIVDGRFEYTGTAIESRDLHIRLRKEIAGYQMKEVLSEMPNIEDIDPADYEVARQSFNDLYGRAFLAKMGFLDMTRARLSEQ